MTETQSSGSESAPPAQASQSAQGIEITPELVRQIADQVYAALLHDLALESERSRRSGTARLAGAARLLTKGRRP
jgi:hypothetical protein